MRSSMYFWYLRLIKNFKVDDPSNPIRRMPPGYDEPSSPGYDRDDIEQRYQDYIDRQMQDQDYSDWLDRDYGTYFGNQ